MAAQKSEFVKCLEEEVKCPLCMDIFVDPKKLPCDHVICYHCLNRLVVRSINGILTCPVCRDTTPLQGPEASHFPTAHQTNRLIDIYKKTLQEEDKSSLDPQPATVKKSKLPTCSIHTFEPLALYCETCKKGVCRDCALTSCAIKNHDYGFLNDMIKKYNNKLEKRLLPVKEIQQDILAALMIIVQKGEELEKHRREEEDKVEAAFDTIINTIEKDRSSLLLEIKQCFNRQNFEYTAKTEELTKCLDQIELNVKSAEVLVSAENSALNIDMIMNLEKNLEDMHHQLKTVTLEPTSFDGLKVKLELLPETFDTKKFLYKTGNGYMYLKSEHEMLKSLRLHQPFKMDVHLKLEIQGINIKSRFVSLFDNSSISVSITKLQSNIVRLEFTPQHRGRHELHIQLQDNTAICGSPISSYVYMDPEQLPSLKSPKRTIVSNACAVKCVMDHVYVTSFEQEVIVLQHKKHSKIRKIGQCSLDITKRISFPCAFDVLIWDQYLYCYNLYSEKVEKMGIDKQIIITSAGGWGTEPGYFKLPKGIQVSRRNEIYICDSHNHRIQVFNTDLKLLRVIGQSGTGCLQFLSPYSLVFDDHDNMYIVEYSNNRIQVLNPQEEHIRFIGSFDGDTFHQPVSAAIHNDHIYVTEEGRNRISVFTLDGRFVTFFGEKENFKPECIDTDRDGYIYVTSGRNTVFMY